MHLRLLNKDLQKYIFCLIRFSRFSIVFNGSRIPCLNYKCTFNLSLRMEKLSGFLVLAGTII